MVILKAENISKQYRLGLVGTGTISHDLNRWWAGIRGKEDPYLKVGEVNDRATKANSDYVWALQDINFEVHQGEVLGIIGKNGAGKSTLLKILSRVTIPTTGQIKTKGRIASLLEVGTGFHPELTGRENIYLNGAILGMNKSEIKSKENEIIEFSGCERYVDTPVKRYSSGMRVRLAFAVAAFLEPDILVIDEVLAVGDAEFQKKAIGKMQDISKTDGRTVLFVSHNMAAVKSLCTKAIVLEHGKKVFKGTSDEAINYYLKLGNEVGVSNFHSFSTSEFDAFDFKIKSIGAKSKDKNFEFPITREDELQVEFQIEKYDQEPINFILMFKDDQGRCIFTANNNHSKFLINKEGNYTVVLNLPKLFFNEGNFYVDFRITKNRKRVFSMNDVIQFSVIQETKALGEWMGKTPGSLKLIFDWELKVN
ncbi:ABC transporter ATP-binding protein [Winogradskyella schleiferi]|uniref:ABC transporter ATP-binding protein n=1 Tax=Winogradskyella schleiferi TaxID=2686078 RepID=UPI0015C0ECEC|nr:polysaccharide ABC transporter ATP-binding protein [Winogradskyella schleiferi]